MDVYGEIEQLRRMPIAELRERYQEVFGDQTATTHKQHLVRRIAWRLQVLAEGDLSERAHRRAMKIADDRDLRVNVPGQRNAVRMFLRQGALIPTLAEIKRRGLAMKSWTTAKGKTHIGQPLTVPRWCAC